MIGEVAPTLRDLGFILPEIILVLGAMGLLMFGLGAGERRVELIWWLAAGIIAIAAVFVLRSGIVPQTAFGGVFIVDAFARLMKMLVLIGSFVALVMSLDYMRDARLLKMEFPVLILIATAGMLLMVSANDLIALYVGLELQSLALYVIAAFRRDSVRSSEAGLKYFVLGALSSGMLLYGASLIYGFTGATTFPVIAEALGQAQPSIGVIFGLVFVFAGLAFKMSAVPFHMWTPDVYEGAPTPVTAFFAAAPKMAAIALTVRFALDAFPVATEQWRQIVIFIAIASMLLGSFAAIGQTNIKRLMAYSSIGHVGYALIGLAAASREGVQGVIVYLLIYLAMTLGTFAFILSMRRGDAMVEDIDELSGLSQRSPMQAFVLAALLFSLAGIPPLAGFFAKFYVFMAAIQAGLYTLAVIGVLASVVGAYYYLRIVKIIYFDAPADDFEPMPFTLQVVFGLSGIVVLFFFLFPAPIVAAAQAAARSLL